MRFTLESGKIIEIPFNMGTLSENGIYEFKCPIAMKEMTNQIKVEMMEGDKVLFAQSYSVEEYAKTIMKGTYDKSVLNMVRAMLNLGAATQELFKYHEERLANRSLNEEQKKAQVPETYFDGYDFVRPEEHSGLKIFSSSLDLKNKVELYFYFNLEEGHQIDEFTFYYDHNILKPEYVNGKYRINMGAMNPIELFWIFSLYVKENSTDKEVTYKSGAFTYGKLAITKINDPCLNKAMFALADYYEAAQNTSI